MTDITEIISLVFGILSAVVTVFVVPFVAKKIGAERFAEISRWVGVAVSAAEQIYSGTVKAGTEKKRFVLDFLNKQGLTYDTDKVDALIEAAVLALKNS